LVKTNFDTTDSRYEEERKMKFKSVPLAFLAAFTLLTVSTPAQDQTEIINKLLHVPKPASTDKSTTNQSQGAPRQKIDGVTSDSTEKCSYAYTSGSGATYMNYCVSVNGTLENFESPAGIEMLDPQGVGASEGYGVCDVTTNTAYWDYNYGDSGNWNAPTLVTHNATEVKIERSTSDGAWLLTQTITPVAGTAPAAKIVMALTNTSGETKLAFLVRSAEFLGDQTGTDGNYSENYDASNTSAWGYIPTFPTYSPTAGDPYGLMLNTVGEPTPASTYFGSGALIQNSGAGPAPCDLDGTNTFGGPVSIGTIINGQGNGAYFYVFELNKKQTATATLRYFSF
jgi:hypothetical protein